jgi:hypothetical protein
MCCFSRPVRHVSKTRIFARPLRAERQLLVYAMSLAADSELAMVLPIPVPPRSAEDAIRFVDLSACPTFFDQLASLFPLELTRGGFAPQPAPAAKRLVVHDVGEFEASFVPTRADFDRLDERFRLPANVWDELPTYADWGFCVFKLKAKQLDHEPGVLERVKGFLGGGGGSKPSRTYHPMAFEFPRRDASALFFPTVHVHDGEAHVTARFDHTLYAQLGGVEPGGEWDRSDQRAGVLSGNIAIWLDGEDHVCRRQMSGDLPNRDVLIPSGKTC